MVTLRMTTARTNGLKSLCAARAMKGVPRYGAARESNVTDVERGYVYWQTVRWLVEHGFARWTTPPYLQLTKAGETYCRQMGWL